MVEPAQGHLRTAGVVRAQEQHDGNPVAQLAFHLGQRLEPLAGETLGEQHEIRRNARLVGELVVAGHEEQLDRFRAEYTVELTAQIAGSAAQRELLVEREAVEIGHRGILQGW